jgi:hypothetical protein
MDEFLGDLVILKHGVKRKCEYHWATESLVNKSCLEATSHKA